MKDYKEIVDNLRIQAANHEKLYKILNCEITELNSPQMIIEAADAIEQLQKNVEKCEKVCSSSEKYIEQLKKERDAAVDAVEVKHGDWIYDGCYEMGGLPKCSSCGRRSHSGAYGGEDNYCPRCGAKMDE